MRGVVIESVEPTLDGLLCVDLWFWDDLARIYVTPELRFEVCYVRTSGEGVALQWPAGGGGAGSSVRGAAQGGAGSGGAPVDWEMGQLYFNNRLGSVTFLRGGSVVDNPLTDGDSVDFLRVFSIGLYQGGMRRLLLRADKTDTHSTRIDLLFMNTQHLSLSTSLEAADVWSL